MAAAASPLVSVYEYLHSDYQPDVDYVDGVLEERNGGEFDHQALQRALLLALATLEEEHGFYTALELRVQVAPARFRVPDVCLLPADRLPQRYVSEAPLLCLEVLSPEDRFGAIRSRCEDYLRMGVPAVWIVDPERRTVSVVQKGGSTREYETGNVPVGELGFELTVDALFGSLPRKA